MTYTARSASDKTDDWPYWMVWNGSLNVTGQIRERVSGEMSNGRVFVSRIEAEDLSDRANAELDSLNG